MKRTVIAICVLGFACSAGAASPAPAPAKNAAVADRVLNAEADARQREIETRLKVMETQSPQVQAEFAVMMEELDANKKNPPATAPAR